jgi:hypothetical protein
MRRKEQKEEKSRTNIREKYENVNLFSLETLMEYKLENNFANYLLAAVLFVLYPLHLYCINTFTFLTSSLVCCIEHKE